MSLNRDLKIQKTAEAVANYLIDVNKILPHIEYNEDENSISDLVYNIATFQKKTKQDLELEEVSKKFKEEVFMSVKESLEKNKNLLFEIGPTGPYGKLQEIAIKTQVPVNTFPANLKIKISLDGVVTVKEGRGPEKKIPVNFANI